MDDHGNEIDLAPSHYEAPRPETAPPDPRMKRWVKLEREMDPTPPEEAVTGEDTEPEP